MSVKMTLIFCIIATAAFSESLHETNSSKNEERLVNHSGSRASSYVQAKKFNVNEFKECGAQLPKSRDPNYSLVHVFTQGEGIKWRPSSDTSANGKCEFVLVQKATGLVEGPLVDHCGKDHTPLLVRGSSLNFQDNLFFYQYVNGEFMRAGCNAQTSITEKIAFMRGDKCAKLNFGQTELETHSNSAEFDSQEPENKKARENSQSSEKNAAKIDSVVEPSTRGPLDETGIKDQTPSIESGTKDKTSTDDTGIEDQSP